jgi:hypothetical protein
LVDVQLLQPFDPVRVYEPVFVMVRVADHAPLLFVNMTAFAPTETEGLPPYSQDPAVTVTVTGVFTQTGFADKDIVCANAGVAAAAKTTNADTDAATSLSSDGA